MPTTRLSSPDSSESRTLVVLLVTQSDKKEWRFKKKITSGGLEMNS
jgi:hypothetical protein